jgi:AcrR family transcriptional regulator
MTIRMSGAERKRAIARAVAPLFARQGFHGTTTRDIARAAGVSEALIYRHFPSKESLYRSIGEEQLENREAHPGMAGLLEMRPSTERLVRDVEYLVAHIAAGREDVQPRLMAQSLLGDGGYARAALRRFVEAYGPHLDASLDAAFAAGDLEVEPSSSASPFLLAHHLALGLRLMFLSRPPAADHAAPREEVVRRAVRFALRGIGLKSTTVDRFVPDPSTTRGRSRRKRRRRGGPE